MSESDTPKTDAKVAETVGKWGFVSADFARELERENAALLQSKMDAPLDYMPNRDLLPFAHFFRMDSTCIAHETYRCERCRGIAQEPKP